MIDLYNFYEQIENWEQDLQREEEVLREELIQKAILYSRLQSVYSKTLDENIKIYLN